MFGTKLDSFCKFCGGEGGKRGEGRKRVGRGEVNVGGGGG